MTSAVVFDMGGVLVELGPLDELLGVEIPPEEFWPAWLASPIVRRFERGQCTLAAFGQGLADELGLTIPPDEVVDRFRRFPRGLLPGAAELVAAVRVTTGVLTNTNRLHWEEQVDAAAVRALFDRHFLSFELGLVKPDEAIFRRVVHELDLDPGDVLFLDDNALNVEGALAVGLDAHVASGVDDARRILDQRRLLH